MPSVTDAVVAVRELVEQSTRIRLLADVPVGISLSGGLDSSIIAAVASRLSEKPVVGVSFTLGNSDQETMAVRDLANHLGPNRISVVTVSVPDKSEMQYALEDAIASQGAPMLTLSSVAQYLVYRKAREIGLKVLLSGQGADEAFMGYRKYQVAKAREELANGSFRALLSTVFWLIRTLAADSPSLGVYKSTVNKYYRRKSLFPQLQLPNSSTRSDVLKSTSTLQREDTSKMGLSTLLRSEDRSSMAHGVEARCPFLDHRVIELGVKLQTDFKIRTGYGKWILRSAFELDLPSNITWARWKRGFDPGTAKWLEHGAGRCLRDIVGARVEEIASVLRIPPKLLSSLDFSDIKLNHSSEHMSLVLALAWIGITVEPQRTN